MSSVSVQAMTHAGRSAGRAAPGFRAGEIRARWAMTPLSWPTGLRAHGDGSPRRLRTERYAAIPLARSQMVGSVALGTRTSPDRADAVSSLVRSRRHGEGL